MKEQDYQSKILKYLNSVGAYTIKVVSAGKKGVPDIVACYRGTFIGIEVKTPTTRNNLSELQKINLSSISDAYGIAVCAVEIDEIKEVIMTIDKDKSNMYLYGTNDVIQIPQEVIDERLKLLRENLKSNLEVDWHIRDGVKCNTIIKAIKFWEGINAR